MFVYWRQMSKQIRSFANGRERAFSLILSIKDGGLIAEDFHASKMAELICRVEISCPGCQHPSLLRDWD